MIMRINLENAEEIIKAMKRRQEVDGKPYCPCKAQSTDENDVCPCFDARINEKCCCGLFTFEKKGV